MSRRAFIHVVDDQTIVVMFARLGPSQSWNGYSFAELHRHGSGPLELPPYGEPSR